MGNGNHKSSGKILKIRGFAFFSLIALLVLIGLANINNVQASTPIPSGFQLISQGTGVSVYRKNYTGGQPDYVTVVDLRYATLRNFTGWVSGTSVERRLLRTFWNDAVSQDTPTRKSRVAINGTFFDPNSNPYTGIAFGLKADWWRMSYGYNPSEFGLSNTLTFAFDSSYGSSSIQPYSTQTFDAGIPNVVGGLVSSCCKSPSSYTQRTLVGVRDDDGNGDSETVIFFSSNYATQYSAISVLSGFGAGSKMLLDGGGSTGLIIDGADIINPENRTIPQAFIICAGK
jgi:Phosphodiester glycosidase